MTDGRREGRADLEFDVDVDDAPAPAPAAPGAPWPHAVPDAAEASRALGRALAGDVGALGAPLAAAAGALTGLERGVLAGAPHPIDTAPIRRGAAMRVRLAVALAGAPAGREEVDAGAVSALLGELDALLSDLTTLAEDAPEDVHAELAALRASLAAGASAVSAAALRAARPAGSD